MRLIMCKEFIPIHKRGAIADLIGGDFEFGNFEGDPYSVIKEKLNKNIYAEDEVFITSDERFLLFYPEKFPIDDIYIYSNGNIKKIQECTNRNLRVGHNLFKLYIGNEFNL